MNHFLNLALFVFFLAWGGWCVVRIILEGPKDKDSGDGD